MLLALLPLVLLSLLRAFAAPSCHPDDRKALEGVKSKLTFPLTSPLALWKGSECCTWPAIECNNNTGRVVRLDIQNANKIDSIRGTLSTSLGQLPSLEFLTISGFIGNVTGSIPASLGKLSNLRGLQLNDNHLTGSIPGSLGSLKKLENLDLSSNMLTGGIADSFGQLNNLWFLVLSSNKLNGILPVSLSSLSRLSDMSLSDNMLTGVLPEAFQNLPSVEYIRLSNNKLSGALPSSWSKMHLLRELSLDNNHFTGKLPSSWGQLRNLTSLSLSSNSLSGSIPSSFSSLQNLDSLSLFNNALSGTLPASLGTLKALRVLLLQKNKLFGKVPSPFASLTNLEAIDLSNNQLSGPFPDLSNSKSLSILFLSHNKFRLNTVPSWLQGLQSNELQLHLASCGLNSLPSFLSELLMFTFDVSMNNITGRIPVFPFSRDGPVTLADFNMSYNPLVVEIGSSFDGYKGLRTLDLGSCRLHGTIPVSLLQNESLEFLNLSDNALSGKIPSGKGIRKFPATSFAHNAALCGTPLPPCHKGK